LSYTFYREKEFVNTQNGKYPKDWAVVTLGEICNTSSGGTPDRQMKEYFKGGIPWVKSGELKDKLILKTEEKITEDGLRNSTAKLFPKGTLLVAMYGATVGKTGILGIDATTNQAVCALSPKEKNVNINYLKYSLISIRNRWISQSAGGAQQNISQEIIRFSRIPFPPYKEQQQIAGILGVVDSALEYADQIIAKSERLKRGLMEQLLTHGIGHKEYKQTPIGQIPTDWKIVKIADVTSHVGSGLTPRGGSSTYLEKGIPLIRSQNVLMNKLDLSDVAHISQDTHEFMSRSVVYPEDVLLNITGASIGRVSVVPDSIKEANVNQHVCRIRLIKDVLPQFTAYYLSSPDGQNQIMSFQAGATRQGLNYQQVRAIQLPCPSIEEQRKIAEILSSADLKIDTERKERATLDRVKKGLMDLLLTGKVRIKVD
jgi:type I restriction enzyme, S subunit